MPSWSIATIAAALSRCATQEDCAAGFACDGEVCVLVAGAEARDCFDLLGCGQHANSSGKALGAVQVPSLDAARPTVGP